MQNYLACAAVRAPKSSYITTALKFLHQLKIKERIDYKILYLTHKVLTTTQLPSYLYDLISAQLHRSTRSSSESLRSYRTFFIFLCESKQSLLPLCVTLIVSGINFLFHLRSLKHTSVHYLLHRHFQHPSLLLVSTPGSKLTFSINPSHHSLPHLPDWSHGREISQ